MLAEGGTLEGTSGLNPFSPTLRMSQSNRKVLWRLKQQLSANCLLDKEAFLTQILEVVASSLRSYIVAELVRSCCVSEPRVSQCMTKQGKLSTV